MLGISAIGWAEFLCGPLDESHRELAARFISAPVSFTVDDALVAARLFNDSGRRPGTSADCIIAAAALRAGASLATTNPSDFRRFEVAGLVLAV